MTSRSTDRPSAPDPAGPAPTAEPSTEPTTDRPAGRRGGIRASTGRGALHALTLAVALSLAACLSRDDGTEPNIPGDTSAFGTIAGTVTDGQGTGVGSAEIRVTNPAGTVDRTTVVNEVGRYTVSDLASGDYTVSITPPQGFEMATGHPDTRHATVEVNSVTEVDFELMVTSSPAPAPPAPAASR